MSKEFDISGYEFSDDDIRDVHHQDYELDGCVYIELKGDTDQVFFNRNDIIAMAKSVSLTPEDLTGKSS